MTALIIILYLAGFVITLKLFKKKFQNNTDDDNYEKMCFVVAGIFFPITLVGVTMTYIGRLLIKFYDWL